MESFHYTLPAVRGRQAGRDYYTAMCPLALVARLFPLDDARLSPELRLQRLLNRDRVPEITRYLTDHPKAYVLSSLTASVDRPVRFEPLSGATDPGAPGHLKIPLAAHLLLHDGLHRRAAIEAALAARPELGDETVSLVLYVDPGLRRAEQVFSDLKRHEARASRSRSIACDHRDELARLVKALVTRVPVFTDLTEMSRSTLSNRSSKLFTFSGIYQATGVLLAGRDREPFSQRLALAADFWTEVSRHIPDWHRAAAHEVTPAELRRTTVHAHALALAALARAGQALLARAPGSWRAKLRPLSSLDWSRGNTALWEGRAMLAGRLSKTRTCVILTGNALKTHLGLPLSPQEQQVESLFRAR